MNDLVLQANPTPVRAWLAVVALGVSAFSIVTSELAPVGMLSALANDLHQSQAGAGLAVTAYGWVAALAALLAGAIPARISRKALLIVLMLILAFSCLAATQSHTMQTFMTARMTGALAHGAFWALIGTVAVQLVPVDKLGLATSVIFAGVSAASVLGVPLSSFIADMVGWRQAFSAISLLSLAAAVALLWTLPTLAAPQPLRLKVYVGIVKNPLLLSLFGATACIISAHFAAFTYLEPLLTQTRGIPTSAISALLLMSGLSGLLGNLIAGKLIDRHIRVLIMTSLLLSAGALGMLSIRGGSALPVWFVAVLLGVWGAGMAIVFVGLQTWLLRSAGEATQPASAIYVAIFNAAIGTGALVGGLVSAKLGLSSLPLLAAVAMICGMALVWKLKSPRAI
ncbi:MFS transporter [Klebsiella aerogenes]|uniref:Major facilitator transporter n=1 Tax=Klebsiella aerogenes (strain ATCC 13048 / DSM 30053 / CCUG 1429 / JCM 1235 / KCTC 2190 / NBRC 13534 / NCIMB 10102 / NCTC 10006 / CDC 819-56) TaxID=1028307 RepID=A0A0H3FTW7_KLEAK|nr:MFS transporter [Klebsiella aerogenes]AEG98044.1 major facilitator transporter [Klebsiella aerogenes KCTC 2190]ATM90760.1 MFS transporter [Klebsiella aerogenes]ATY03251.1 MFS transporter [Klebsiella aerogenes]EIV5434454.1 MFS transporter [Klebsiella aerogenes]EIV6852822.1 MFS transporter [Klebsiella aerogenes]